MGKPWIGVDFDGSVSFYTQGDFLKGIAGPPIMPMVERIREWLKEGIIVKIFTARVAQEEYRELHTKIIQDFCMEQFGQKLEVTCSKDYDTIEIWDDRAVQLEFNTGRRIGE